MKRAHVQKHTPPLPSSPCLPLPSISSLSLHRQLVREVPWGGVRPAQWYTGLISSLFLARTLSQHDKKYSVVIRTQVFRTEYPGRAMRVIAVLVDGPANSWSLLYTTRKKVVSRRRLRRRSMVNWSQVKNHGTRHLLIILARGNRKQAGAAHLILSLSRPGHTQTS